MPPNGEAGSPHPEDYEPDSPSPTTAGEGDPLSALAHNRPQVPLQKRRRVTRACDECRRKKIKCDGKQPCTHCTVYSYDCTYDQPSNRRRNPTPQYIEGLENRLQRAEALLRSVLPGVDLNDPNLGGVLPPLVQLPPGAHRNSTSAPTSPPTSSQSNQGVEKDSLLESMIEGTGDLAIDRDGHYDYTGGSSGRSFVKRITHQFGDIMPIMDESAPVKRSMTSAVHSPRASSDSPIDHGLPYTVDLPHNKNCGKLLCERALDDALCLMRFMHRPTFFVMFDRVYDIPTEQWGNEEHKYLPLVYAVMALGSLFAKDENSRLEMEGYEIAIDSGYKFFQAARSMIDITDCRDIPSLQTIVFMVIFLQSSAAMSTCYSYIGVGYYAAIRMGLHRALPGRFSPIEEELRKRLFWQIRKMNIFIGSTLGLPLMLNEEDIDQQLPLEIDDEFILADRILPMPPDRLTLMTATNAHTRIVRILRKVIRYIYPLQRYEPSSGLKSQTGVVSHTKIREIECDLQEWMESLPMGFRPGGEVSPELSRVQQLLRMTYAHVQMLTYRPFLHYSTQAAQARNPDKTSYACAAACVSVSRNIIHITVEMNKRGLLIGAYWFTMYTTFWAVLSLVYFVMENSSNLTSSDILSDAHTGREILAVLAKRSLAADRSTKLLNTLFARLPPHLHRGSRSSASTPGRKRQATSNSRQDGDRGAAVALPGNSNSIICDPTQLSQRSSNFPLTNNLSVDDVYKHTPIPPVPFPQPLQPRSNPDYPSPTPALYTPPDSTEHIPQSGNISPSSAQNPSVPMAYAGPNSTLYNLQPAIADLSAMMFPSSDPFAYPNQPMTALENAGFGAVDAAGPFQPQQAYYSNGSTTPNTSDGKLEPGLELHNFFGPIPAWLMSPHQQAAPIMQPDGGLLAAQDWAPQPRQLHAQPGEGRSLGSGAGGDAGGYEDFFANGDPVSMAMQNWRGFGAL